MRRTPAEDAEPNMTPMIDVVFQLMIFFIITLQMSETSDPAVVPGDSPHGPELVKAPGALIIDADRNGRLSLQGREVTLDRLRTQLARRIRLFGNRRFPVLIRADYRTRHQDVRHIMDVCAALNVRQLSFVAIKEHRVSQKPLPVSTGNSLPQPRQTWEDIP